MQTQIPTTRTRVPAATAATLAAYCALIAGAYLAGQAMQEAGRTLRLGVPPLFANLEPHLGLALLAPAAFAAVIVYFHEPIRTLRWGALLAVSFLGSGIWAVLLAATRGWDALSAPVANPTDVWGFIPRMPDPSQFLSTFVTRIADYPIHVRGHPPGLALLLQWMDGAGLGSRQVVAGLFITAGASLAPAVLVGARSTAGEARARLAAPFLILAPFALWTATSPDALFAAVAAWGIVLMIAATPSPNPALIGGAVFGGALLLTYGAAPLLLIPALVWTIRRRVAPLLWAGVGIVAVLAIPAGFGFWWHEGLLATREQYYAGLGGLRPYRYFVWANLAALALAIGPAPARGLVRIVSALASGKIARALAPWPAIGALGAVALADLSGLSKGEVERIWLLFSPWLILAAAYLPDGSRRRAWLAVTAAGTIALQAMLSMPW